MAVTRFLSLPECPEKTRQLGLVQKRLDLVNRPREVDYSDLYAVENAILHACPAGELPFLREQILVRYRAIAGEDDPIVLRYYQQSTPNPHAVTVGTGPVTPPPAPQPDAPQNAEAANLGGQIVALEHPEQNA